MQYGAEQGKDEKWVWGQHSSLPLDKYFLTSVVKTLLSLILWTVLDTVPNLHWERRTY